MATKFKLIATAVKTDNQLKTEISNITGNIKYIAEQCETTPVLIAEHVIQVLANMASKAEQGQPLSQRSTERVTAAFLAGVELMASELPSLTDDNAKSNELRALLNAQVRPGGLIQDTSSLKIAKHAWNNSDIVDNYKMLLSQHAEAVAQGSSSPIVPAIKKLQQQIDQAMNIAMKPQRGTLPPSTPSRAGAMPASSSGV